MKSTAFKPAFVLALLACLVSGAGAQAACTYFDDFQENGDGTVTDPRDGLVWQKCALGQEWTGSDCSGTATEMDWFQAMKAAKKHRFLGKKDWRLPTKDEILAVVGDFEQCKNQPAPGRAASRSLAYPVRDDGRLGWYWSGSPNASNSDYAWYVNFGKGYAGNHYYRNSYFHVRLVRGGQSFGSLEFAREYAKLGQYQREIEAKKHAAEKEEKLKAQKAEREAKERAREKQQYNYAACDQLYPGKPVYYRETVCFFGCDLHLRSAVIVGVSKSNGVASAKITEGEKFGDIMEQRCSDW